ncbi:hypothetical protein GGX14DRAFT_395652 [Mycena pura]|uniref:Uncharacterized protein n=1 Tax=Mycena pura TaxID=153505 RepID=A0AAD6YAG4_9AGAR|nr:hypothetical protein GGX14DRAFT_395652 [Mycena pura]
MSQSTRRQDLLAQFRELSIENPHALLHRSDRTALEDAQSDGDQGRAVARARREGLQRAHEHAEGRGSSPCHVWRVWRRKPERVDAASTLMPPDADQANLMECGPGGPGKCIAPVAGHTMVTPEWCRGNITASHAAAWVLSRLAAEMLGMRDLLADNPIAGADTIRSLGFGAGSLQGTLKNHFLAGFGPVWWAVQVGNVKSLAYPIPRHGDAIMRYTIVWMYMYSLSFPAVAENTWSQLWWLRMSGDRPSAGCPAFACGTRLLTRSGCAFVNRLDTEDMPIPHLDSHVTRTRCRKRSAIFLSASLVENATTKTGCLLRRKLPCTIGVAICSTRGIEILLLVLLMVGIVNGGSLMEGGGGGGVSGLTDGRGVVPKMRMRDSEVLAATRERRKWPKMTLTKLFKGRAPPPRPTRAEIEEQAERDAQNHAADAEEDDGAVGIPSEDEYVG